jgi:hypothetical protein
VEGPHVLVPCIAVNIKFLLAIFKEGAGNISLLLAGMLLICTSQFS